MIEGLLTMIIYKITNSVNKKVYVGLTRDNLDSRWKNHLKFLRSTRTKSKLYNAMLKYGIDKFSIHQIDTAQTPKELSEKEVLWIKSLDSVKSGYNILSGGIDFNSDNMIDYWAGLSLSQRRNYAIKMSASKQGISSKKRASPYIGVYLGPKHPVCQIIIKGKKLSKTFDTELSAAKAYDMMALLHYGATAKTNFPQEEYRECNLNEFMIEWNAPRIRFSITPHKYKSVVFSKTTNQWVGRVIENGKPIKSFYRQTEEGAFAAKEEFIRLRHQPVDTPR